MDLGALVQKLTAVLRPPAKVPPGATAVYHRSLIVGSLEGHVFHRAVVAHNSRDLDLVTRHEMLRLRNQGCTCQHHPRAWVSRPVPYLLSPMVAGIIGWDLGEEISVETLVRRDEMRRIKNHLARGDTMDSAVMPSPEDDSGEGSALEPAVKLPIKDRPST